MRPQLECLICLLDQGLRCARRALPDNSEKHEELVRAWSAELATMDMKQTVPHWAGHLYPLGAKILGVADPFMDAKQTANERVLDMLPALRDRVRAHANPLHAALNISIIGNYIDLGIKRPFDWEQALADETDMAFLGQAFEGFLQTLRPGAHLLILGDNAGEIGLDTILVELLRERQVDVTYAVRSAPILNDALVDDARFVGMDRLCAVMPSGCKTCGTILEQGSPEFLEAYHSADAVLSKGQGNFEALYDRAGRPIYFAFKAKCDVVCDLLDCSLGSSMFLHQE